MIEPKSIEEAIVRESAAKLADLLTAVMPENYSVSLVYPGYGHLRGGLLKSGPAVKFRLKPDIRACGHSWDFTVSANCEIVVVMEAKTFRFDLSDPDCFDKIVDTVLEHEGLA